MKRLPNLYLDLDGVMADFEKGYSENFNANCADEDDDILWQNINSNRSFFADLELYKDADVFYEKIQKLQQPIILSACPKSDYHNAAILKRAWVKKNVDNDIVILTVLGGKNKPLFMHEKGDVLIDDMQKNIDAWNAFGGIGILHDGDFDKTFAALEEIYT